MLKKLLFLIVFCLVSLLVTKPVLAADEFSTSYDVRYDVNTDGTTKITQKVDLKNLTSKYYASNYTLTIGSTKITEVEASDRSGKLESTVETKDNKTSINVKFREPVAGIDKSQVFTLTFKSRDFAQSIGKIWEVNLPKIPISENIQTYNLSLTVPINFGEPTSVSPLPKFESQSGDRLVLSYSKEQLEKTGVSVNFGKNQLYDFVLKYKLENNSLSPAITHITLPPDTQYQDVLINNIDPSPTNVTIDEDGNLLAWYKIPRSSNQTVTIKGSAKLYINSKTKNETPLSKEQLALWTNSDKYWEKDNPLIQTLVKDIFKSGLPKTNKEKVRVIYKYVVDTLKYDTSRISNDTLERLGAVTAINNPETAVCMEFTDVFVTLSRAVGVPARELDGYAYTQNTSLRPLSLTKDLLHAWPEYYDEESGGWVMVDPTWENTSGGVDYFNKFDLNHFVLAIKGKSSQTPSVTDEVEVTVTDADFKPNPQLVLEVQTPEVFWAGLNNPIKIKVYNQGQSIQSPTSLNLISGKIKSLNSNSVILGSIPPYGYTTYDFDLRSDNLWDQYEDKINIQFAGQKYEKNILIKPFFIFQPFPYVLLGLIGIVVGIYFSLVLLHFYKNRTQTEVKAPVATKAKPKRTFISSKSTKKNPV